MDLTIETLKGFSRMFYLASPSQTSFRTVEEIPNPDYVTQAIPYFLTLLFLENIILWIKKKPLTRINDGITSLSHGIFLGCGGLVVRGIDSYFYIKIYENWRLVELPWDSPYTWYAAALVTDLGYYWFHRAAHEINIFWSQHQVHHSSEDYNLSTALRQSTFQGWVGWMFYLPIAFFIPPSIHLIHRQFNVLYQFWIHTEVVDSLGPLEYVLNTPRHHRIHHGSNRYCLDKNYAGVLIIWDRMFGTFAETKPGEQIVYGLVEDLNSFNPFWLQFFYIGKIREKIKEQNNWKDKLSAAFKGPGWMPGKPRLGDINDVPEIPDRQKHDVQIPMWQNIYISLHFLSIIFAFENLTSHEMTMSQLNVLICVGFIIFSLTSFGFLLDGRKIGTCTEILRCSLVLFIPTFLSMSSFASTIIYELFTLSLAAMIYWLIFGELKKTTKFPEGKTAAEHKNGVAVSTNGSVEASIEKVE